jgi:hypothetical protein
VELEPYSYQKYSRKLLGAFPSGLSMKFGKRLLEELCIEAWQENYVQYENLKQLIYQASSATEPRDNVEQRFLADLEASVERVLAFIDEEAARISKELAVLPAGLAGDAGQAQKLASVAQNVADLEQFISVNKEALRKIVKKATRRIQTFKHDISVESSFAERSDACVRRLRAELTQRGHSQRSRVWEDLEVADVVDTSAVVGGDGKGGRPQVLADEDGDALADAPFILMAKRNSFAVEGQGCAVIVVHRVGSAATIGKRCEADFTTAGIDGHKASDGDFVETSGTLCFGPHETEKRIRVPLADDSRWEPMERFIVRLTAARGAALGLVTETLVHIVDDDLYPANLPPDASEWQLLRAFYRERWRHRWPKPLKSLLYDMYESFHDLLGTYLPLVCAEASVRKQPLWLALFGALYVTSSAFNWYCSYQFQNHRGNSGTRKDWRNWLVNRFVWLAEERHLQVDPMRWFHTVRTSTNVSPFRPPLSPLSPALNHLSPLSPALNHLSPVSPLPLVAPPRPSFVLSTIRHPSHLPPATHLTCHPPPTPQVSNDVDEAVKKCWHEHYIFINAFVDVVLQLGVAAAVLGWLAVSPLAIVIPTLVIMIHCTWRPLIRKLDTRYAAEDSWMHYVMDHASNWLLVQTHEMRDESSMEFSKKNNQFYKDHRAARFLELHMEETPKMASEAGLAAIIVAGALLIEGDSLSVGQYLSLVKVRHTAPLHALACAFRV